MRLIFIGEKKKFIAIPIIFEIFFDTCFTTNQLCRNGLVVLMLNESGIALFVVKLFIISKHEPPTGH